MGDDFPGFDHPPPPFVIPQQAPSDQQPQRPQLAELFPEFLLPLGSVSTGNSPWDQDSLSQSPYTSLSYDEMMHFFPELSSYAPPPPPSHRHYPFVPENCCGRFCTAATG